MSESNAVQFERKPPVPVNKVGLMAPFGWLSKGFSDLKAAKLPSLLYGLVFAVIGLFLVFMASENPLWSVAFTSAFLLMGPFLAIGLYALSSQIENNEKPCLIDSIKKIKENLVGLGFFVVLLSVLLIIWLRISAMVAGVFFDDLELITKGWSVLFQGNRSIEFLLFFTFFGFFIAQLVFSISVVSIPMLLDRKVDVITAITTSLRVVMKNPLPMFVWAIIIVALINLGMLFAFVGLAITLPIIGHASWHAYQELVGE
ncbi:MAG: DUF2189 domain-containing protein [Thiotrichaceae bacterium]|nr:DUF2189 domain-containing protein [Thiotrichaceae bacterium]